MIKFILCIVGILVELIILIGVFISIYKEYKDLHTITEKTLFCMLILIFLYPLIMFTFDRANLASKIGWVDESNSERWFNYLVTYGSSLVSAIIGSISLVLMTIFQLKRQDEKDNETARINNMPLLNYEIIRNKGDAGLDNLLITNCKKGKIIDFKVKIRNVGMNTVKKSFVVLSSKDLPDNIYSWLDNKGCINKDESVSIYRYLKLSKGKHIINFSVFYCDLINNWYSQNIVISFDISDYSEKNGGIHISSIKVENEKLIKEEPKELMKFL